MSCRLAACLVPALAAFACSAALAQAPDPKAPPPADKRATAPTQAPDAKALPPVEKRNGLLTLAFRDAPIEEVFEMLARGERVNIVLRKGVTGKISVNLFNVGVDQAIQTIAEAGGYAVEQPRPGEYVILERNQAGLEGARSGMRVRAYKVQYSNPKFVAEILAKHVSRQGKITPLLERNLVVVEDYAEYQERIASLLREIDVEPKQILIEAKILEISLSENESFGLDWKKITNTSTGSGFGTQGLASPGTPGFFFSVINDKLTAFLSALNTAGRVHTLSTPKLLALEHQEAAVMIGDRIGYKVTTTINLVTSETIQFLETGVILRVTPSVDERGRIMMHIHPEISTGSITDGIPSKKSTEVTTQLLAQDGQSILIGGLLQHVASRQRSGVPVLGALPVVGALFANKDESTRSTETVVLITPHVVRQPGETVTAGERETVQRLEDRFLKQSTDLDNNLPFLRPENQPSPPPARQEPAPVEQPK